MTSNSSLKAAVRARMERTGEPYAEARRALTDPSPTPGRTPLPAPGYMVQMSETSNGSLPYPAFLTSQGYLFNSLFDYGWVIGFEDALSPERRIALAWPEFVADPSRAVGMVPVTRDPFTDVWSSWGTAVRTIEALDEAPVHEPERAERVAEVQERRTLDDPVAITLSDGQEWEIDGPGLVNRVNGRPFATVGEFVHEDGAVLGWGRFMADPESMIGARLVLWSCEGVRHDSREARIETVERL